VAASCTLAIVSGTGRRLRDFPVETSGQALIEAISAIPGHRHTIMEEGTQSAWLYETLERHVDEIVVASVPESRGHKNAARDAYGLAEKLRIGAIDRACPRHRRSFAGCGRSPVSTRCLCAMSSACGRNTSRSTGPAA